MTETPKVQEPASASVRCFPAQPTDGKVKKVKIPECGACQVYRDRAYKFASQYNFGNYCSFGDVTTNVDAETYNKLNSEYKSLSDKTRWLENEVLNMCRYIMKLHEHYADSTKTLVELMDEYDGLRDRFLQLAHISAPLFLPLNHPFLKPPKYDAGEAPPTTEPSSQRMELVSVPVLVS